jgi:hypothetical protein
MTDEEMDQLSCDEILVTYLGEVSKRVNLFYFKTVLKFVLLYRECLNE